PLELHCSPVRPRSRWQDDEPAHRPLQEEDIHSGGDGKAMKASHVPSRAGPPSGAGARYQQEGGCRAATRLERAVGDAVCSACLWPLLRASGVVPSPPALVAAEAVGSIGTVAPGLE